MAGDCCPKMPSWCFSPFAFPFSAKDATKASISESEELFSQADLQDDIILFHHGGLEGLPSFDADCLKIHILFRLAGIEHKCEVTKEGLMSPTGELPFIMSSKGRCLAGPDLEELLLRQLNVEVPEELVTLVKEKIRPIWASAVWSEPAIYEHILKPLYATPYCMPVRELLIWKKQRGLVNGARLTKESMQEFDLALERLEEVLDEKHFFGGDKLNALDALLGPDLMLIPFFLAASHQLHHIFSQHHYLHDYSLRLLEYFRHEYESKL